MTTPARPTLWTVVRLGGGREVLTTLHRTRTAANAAAERARRDGRVAIVTTHRLEVAR